MTARVAFGFDRIADPPPVVRLLTPKATKSSATPKSKGCAFLEFTHKNALQQALKLHHSELDGRRINVELTAGGGGKSETRLNKVKERNKELNTRRMVRILYLPHLPMLTENIQKKEVNGEEAKGKRRETREEPKDNIPDRHSNTSGIEKAHDKPKTWTVGDAEDGRAHRGGRKHRPVQKKREKKKPLVTGVNAIPVG